MLTLTDIKNYKEIVRETLRKAHEIYDFETYGEIYKDVYFIDCAERELKYLYTYNKLQNHINHLLFIYGYGELSL